MLHLSFYLWTVLIADYWRPVITNMTDVVSDPGLGHVSAAGLGHVSKLGHVTWPAVVVEVLLCVCCVLGGLLNSMILLLFARRRSFRTLSNRWELELATNLHKVFTITEKAFSVIVNLRESLLFVASSRASVRVRVLA